MKNAIKLVIMLLLSLLLTGCTYIDNDEKYGLASGNYNLTTELIYQKEGYVPAYSYQFERDVFYEELPLFDIAIGTHEYSTSILKPDGVFEKVIFPEYQALQKELFSKLSKEEVNGLEMMEWEIESIALQDATYYFLESQSIQESDSFQVKLYRISQDGEITSKSLDVQDDLKQGYDGTRFAIHEGNIISVYDRLRFNEYLEDLEVYVERELFSKLPQEETDALKEKEWTIEAVTIGKTTYYLLESQEMPDPDYCQVKLYRISKDGEILRKEIVVESCNISNYSDEAKLAKYEEKLLCLYCTYWFDKNLEEIYWEPKPDIIDPLEKEEIANIMRRSGNETLKLLAEDSIHVDGTYGDIGYCYWYHVSNDRTRGEYFMEIDMKGEVLSLRKINGISEGVVYKITPKLYTPEDDKYYDVVR